ncbi:glycerophosphodiester phosphodiesterase [Fodinibius sediminis]|nr:glycerophosphodiester phosphodiesterase family protein [Fodinibius sediminis]
MSQHYRFPKLFQPKKKDDCIVIAHRGASAYYPENTMAAFRGAVAMNSDMIELDVMLSSDGVPVVFHDARLEEHTTGRGLLTDYSLPALRALDAGSWFGSPFAGSRIPTLEEVLEFASDTIALNIEIKTEAVSKQQGGVEEKCLELVEAHGMKEHVLFSSFDYRAVTHLKTLDPAVPVALLYNRSLSNGKMPSNLVATYRADAFNCSYREFTKKWRKNIREHKIPHFVYTVDRPRQMRKLLAAGVDGIFTNKPDLLQSVAAQWRASK